MSFDQFATLSERTSTEIVTHSFVRDVSLRTSDGRDAGTMALITLDNGLDHRRPTTLGPASMIELGRTLEALQRRAEAGEISAVGITGKPYFLAAGADLSMATSLTQPDDGRALATLGHAVYSTLGELDVPSFVFYNGAALGGGLEIGLSATYRTVSSGAGALGLPEAFLGLVPGWGGVYRLPRLIGPEATATVMIDNALNNNRTLSGPAAYALGVADALFEPADFLEQSLQWSADVLSGIITVERPNSVSDPLTEAESAAWDAAVQRSRATVAARTSNVAPGPLKVVDLLEFGKNATAQESAQAEIEALSELILSDQFHATVYAFLDLVQKRAKRPAGAPDAKLARPITKVGVVGAGLMASQLALVFARSLKVPVVLTDVSQERVDQGVARVHAEVDKLLAKKKISPDAANRTKALVTGSISKSVYADADFVIEAVFEEIGVKKAVFAELEDIVSDECILATNTSSLSVTDMAADLRHPERVVGFHFFNPVAVMPLIEIVRAPETEETVLATAFAVAKGLRKTAVLVKDATGFVVNRLLLRLMSEVARAFDEGTPAEVADNALRPMGLPMTPFTLLSMVGIPVAVHVSESLHNSFGERFWVSENQKRLIEAGKKSLWEKDASGTMTVPEETLALLSFGNNPVSAELLAERVADALALEVHMMLDEGVVQGPEDIDLCMILGAGWPMFNGGLTPYLDRIGASDRVNGKRFLAPGIASR